MRDFFYYSGWLEPFCPGGLWYGALEGNWIIESRAWSMLWRRIGYRNDCECRAVPNDWGAPIHYRTDQAKNPRWCKVFGEPNFVANEPNMRSFILERECSGRFVRPRVYLWKPDVELWVEWYAQHIAHEAEWRLGVAEAYKEEVGCGLTFIT